MTSTKESNKNIQNLINQGIPEDYIKSNTPGEKLDAKEAAKLLTGWQGVNDKFNTLPDAVKNDPAFAALPLDQKEIVAYNYEVQKANDTQKAQALADALEQATAQADPYWKNIIRVAQDEVLRGIEEANGDYTSSVERQKRRIEEINQDLESNKEFLSLEQQSELANLAADLQDKVQTFERNMQYLGEEKAAELQKLELNYNKSIDEINSNTEYTEAEKKTALDKLARDFKINQDRLTEGAAEAGLTFSTKKKVAEQRLKEENLGLVESTERQYNKQLSDLAREKEYAAAQKALQSGDIERETALRLAEQQQAMATAQRQTESSQEEIQRQYSKQIADLEIEASRGNTEAQAQIADLKRKLSESITGIGRAAESYLGTENLPKTDDYTPLGNVPGQIYEEKVQDIEQRKNVLYNDLTASSLNI